MIGADQGAIVDPAERQRRAAVDAEVFEGGNAVGSAEEDEPFVEQRHRVRLVGQLVGSGDRVPVVTQHRRGHIDGSLADGHQ